MRALNGLRAGALTKDKGHAKRPHMGPSKIAWKLHIDERNERTGPSQLGYHLCLNNFSECAHQK
jgi:hypothetical protein